MERQITQIKVERELIKKEETMISEEARRISSQCRHYAMCKIDFLRTGLCPAGEENHFVSYYPQGRMDIYHALANNRIPVTERLVDIADTCTLCGVCDKQCYFVTELRPMKVMAALKDYVEAHVRAGKEVVRPESDSVLARLREVVGEKWATNDPAILASYSHDPGVFTGVQTPRYVIMPGKREEVSQIVKICNGHHLPFAVRGNGSSVMGFVFAKDGLVMDMGRMKRITLDKSNWYASVEAGVAAFELQKEVAKHGLRVNVAEPSALVCANLMCSGIFSTFSASYGTAANNYINAEFVGLDGEVFHLNQREAPNLFAFHKEELPLPGICTRADVKVYPTTEDEDGILVPFSGFHDAVAFSRELGRRRIGLAVAVLGGEYMSTFMSPTEALGDSVKSTFKEDLGIEYAVLVIGDRYALQAVRTMTDVVIDGELLKIFTLGLPRMAEDEWKDLVRGLEGSRAPYKILMKPEMHPLIEAVLKPSPELLAQAVEPDLRDFFVELYSRHEMSNLVWLNMFRIISSRMGRRKHAVAFIVYVPLDDIDLAADINDEFKRIGDSQGVSHDYGFITPLDFGKRAVFEYDYYVDHTDPFDVQRMQQAIDATAQMIEGFSQIDRRVKWIRYVLYQGFARMENLLYL